jgi:hypothetical protein
VTAAATAENPAGQIDEKKIFSARTILSGYSKGIIAGLSENNEELKPQIQHQMLSHSINTDILKS